jgi:hypothetical protein
MDEGTFTPDEVKAWWAYGELASSRWRDAYAARLPADIVALAARGTPFAALPRDALPLLAGALRAVRIAGFVDGLDASPSYRLTGLAKRQLLRLWVIPLFSPGGQSPARYALFYAGRPLDAGDPRALLAGRPAGPHRPGPPVIVGAFHDGGRLVEGYFRSLVFMRDAPPDALLPALCPIGLDLAA